MMDLSDDSNLDIWEYLLKNEGSTKHKTTLNCDLIEMEEKSLSQNANQEVIDFGIDIQPAENQEVLIEENVPIFEKSQSLPMVKKQEDNQDKFKKCKKPINLSLREKKSVFRTQLIKKEGKKNTNLPKFLVRIFLKHKGKEVDEEVEKNLKDRVTNNFNMKDLMGVLGNDSENGVGSERRSEFRKILREKIKEEVILNSYVTNNRLTYMMTSKVYSIRCRHK